jgi:hypothetical protein
MLKHDTTKVITQVSVSLEDAEWFMDFESQVHV